jgi:hypothetical protein
MAEAIIATTATRATAVPFAAAAQLQAVSILRDLA